MPEELLITHTGPDGTYRIGGLPREAEFLCLIDPGPEYNAFSKTIATTTQAIPNVLSLGYEGALDHTFAAPRDVRVAVSYSDTNLPARNAWVRAKTNRELLRAGSVGETDDNGRTTLHLRPGEYELAIEPPLGAVYRPGRQLVTIDGEEVADVADLKLEPAALVTLEAVNAQTGTGIAGVRFQFETDAMRQRRNLSSQLVFPDHPASDDNGRLRAVVEPGRRRFFVESVPSGWTFENTSNEFVELAVGRETTVRFAFKTAEVPKVPTPAGGTAGAFSEDVIERVRRQQRLTRSGKFRVRYYTYYLGDDPMAVGPIVAYLDANDLSQSTDPVASLAAAFPALPKPGASFYKIIDDGQRRRNTFRFDSEVRELFDTVSNGLEIVDYNSANSQANVFDARKGGLRVLGVSDFSSWPWLDIGKTGSRTAKDEIQRVETGDRLIVEQKIEDSVMHWVVDRNTGFLLASSWRSKRNGYVGGSIRQYGPKMHEGGGILPTVHVQLYLLNDRVDQIFMTVVENADLSYRPAPLDFVVPAPAGTVIVDYREDREHPKIGTSHYPVADVITYADVMSGAIGRSSRC